MHHKSQWITYGQLQIIKKKKKKKNPSCNSALVHTPVGSEYHPSELGPVVSALSLSYQAPIPGRS